MDSRAPPVIDFSPFNGTDTAKKQHLVDQVRAACLEKGFFQVTNHGVSEELQNAVLEQARALFALPLEEKMKINMNAPWLGRRVEASPYNRGYEPVRAQSFEKGSPGDLKEGFYLGRHLPVGHPAVLAKKFNTGPNQYPESISDPQRFRSVVDTYHAAMTELARKVLRVLALTLELEEDWFEEFAATKKEIEPMALLRLLYYPPQPPNKQGPLEKGTGAHTDFGGITLLLQDSVGGLQVFDGPSETWIDVVPVSGAFVVNLGNLMMRWSNDRYVSNLHRVVNTSGRERYSVPFFFSGNPDFLVECLPTCKDGGVKYPPVTAGRWIQGRYADTFGEREGEEGKAVGDLSRFAVKAR